MVKWSTLITDDQGDIDYARVRSLVSVILATIGGCAAIWVIFVARQLNESLIYAMIGALVLPLTGGKIADALSARKTP